MKFIAASALALVAADKASIDRQLIAMIKNSTLRAFTGQIQAAIPGLDEYGCWCYFYDNVGRGKGNPVDEVDSMCKVLGEGYECAIRDSEDESLDCVPWEIDYLVGTGSGRDLYDSCKSLNANLCAARACAVEGTFVENLFAVLLSGQGIPYDQYSHAQGFDPAVDQGCPVKKGTPGSGPEKACCGAYPTRFPYKTLGGERGCCGARTYSTSILNCCSPGKVRANC